MTSAVRPGQDHRRRPGERHQQANATLSDLLQKVEGVSNEEVGAQILALQTTLQASLQTTAILYQTSILKYL
jgi:flagellar hook-associated protein 3 FlgL